MFTDHKCISITTDEKAAFDGLVFNFDNYTQLRDASMELLFHTTNLLNPSSLLRQTQDLFSHCNTLGLTLVGMDSFDSEGRKKPLSWKFPGILKVSSPTLRSLSLRFHHNAIGGYTLLDKAILVDTYFPKLEYFFISQVVVSPRALNQFIFRHRNVLQHIELDGIILRLFTDPDIVSWAHMISELRYLVGVEFLGNTEMNI
ncbi:MAG: hypothetical protein M1834_004696 [Cirrosporium novae-zelandiae]|nr:MAG: hypothetical protein M1834_004696 [Cirrosporium novae-zelandiae]